MIRIFTSLPLIALMSQTAPALAEGPPSDEAAIAVFKATFLEECSAAFQEDGTLIEPPERFEVKSPTDWGEDSEVVVWEFRCDIYAYNTSQVFMISTDMGGVQPVALARPTLRIEYDEAAEEPGEANSVVKLLEINGWDASPVAINASFDPATLTISSYTYWRGIGDASDAGVWRLRNQSFRLVQYDVDASYDGEVTPVTLVDLK